MENREAPTDEVAQGIQWAHGTAGADVISASWGYTHDTQDPLINDAISDAIDLGRNGKGTVVVFSAGNGATQPVEYPARLTSTYPVISVSAINKTGGRPAYGKQDAGKIDVVAPSGHTTQPCPDSYAPATLDRFSAVGCPGGGPEGSERYNFFSGTSAAAPQVAGVAALMLSRMPHLTAAQVKWYIRRTAHEWGDEAVYGQGKLNALYAVMDFAVEVDGPDYIDSTKEYSWNALVSGGGTGNYSYRWEYRIHHVEEFCSFIGEWMEVGSSATYSRNEGPGGYDFQLRVTVSDLSTGIVDQSPRHKVYRAQPLPCPM